MESALRFIQELLNDEGMYTRYHITDPDSVQEFIRFGFQKGYVFTEDELRAALATLPPDSPVFEYLKT